MHTRIITILFFIITIGLCSQVQAAADNTSPEYVCVTSDMLAEMNSNITANQHAIGEVAILTGIAFLTISVCLLAPGLWAEYQEHYPDLKPYKVKRKPLPLPIVREPLESTENPDDDSGYESDDDDEEDDDQDETSN
jgi:hypothetical protein